MIDTTVWIMSKLHTTLQVPIYPATILAMFQAKNVAICPELYCQVLAAIIFHHDRNETFGFSYMKMHGIHKCASTRYRKSLAVCETYSLLHLVDDRRTT